MFFPSSANNYNVNPFSRIPSSSYHPSGQALLTHESDDILFNHHHDMVPASSMLPAANPQQQLSLNETLLNMALLSKDGGNHPGFGFPIKKAVKKDRHSKICTAQGVRDRRVRLSIEIAREFFDLQDMLGFDKASKTVEWLLRKSKNAIQEVVKMKQYGNGCAYEDPYEMVAENGVLDEETAFQSNSPELEKKMKKLTKTSVPLLAKESRAKARARARERTREKMCSGSGTANSLTQPAISKKSDHLAYGYNNHSMASSSFNVAEQHSTAAASRENVNEESIVITRMVKPSTILGYQPNYLATSNDSSCNSNGNNGFPNLSQNMDINGANAMAHSTLCAMTNVNLSTAGVQLYGKP